MRILINASCSKGGGIQVCDSLIRTLAAFPQHTFLVCASYQVRQSLGESFVSPENVTILKHPQQSLLQRLCGKAPVMDKLVAEHQIEAVFTVFGPSFWKPQVPHLCGFAIPHYVYPESQFLKKQRIVEKIKLWGRKRLKIRSFKNHSSAIVTENPVVSQRLRDMFKIKQTFTVYNTCNAVFFNEAEWDWNCHLPEFTGTTILTISSYYPHKNLESLVPVARILKNIYPEFSFRFVLSIQQEQLESDLSGVEDHFVFLGKIPIIQCPHLYQQADIMFLPSLLECFSAAWVEAMTMEVPIITSDLPFAHGICENAAKYVDPYASDKIAETIHQLALSGKERHDLAEKGKIIRRKFENSVMRTTHYLSILGQLTKKKRQNNV